MAGKSAGKRKDEAAKKRRDAKGKSGAARKVGKNTSPGTARKVGRR